MTQNDLLPQNATPLERAFSLATSPAVRLDPPVTAMRGIKYIATPPSWLPFLIYEYGLGELSPYVPSLYDLIEEGIDWQRVRGTPSALNKSLGWLGYGADIEEAAPRRTRWHLFQLEMDRVRDNDEPDLARIEGVAQLSAPVRSHFWRGFKTYDVREAEYGWESWGNAMWSDDSGVRLIPGHAKWSFGREHVLSTTLTQAVLEAFDVWSVPVQPTWSQTWAATPWPAEPWSAPGQLDRRTEIVNALHQLPAWVTFIDAQGSVVGHRKARAWHKVTYSGADAPYKVNGIDLAPVDAYPSGLYVEAMTDFGEGYGHTASKWQVRLGATLLDPTRPGQLWAQPGELTGGTVAAEKTETVEFGKTVREICRALLAVA